MHFLLFDLFKKMELKRQTSMPLCHQSGIESMFDLFLGHKKRPISPTIGLLSFFDWSTLYGTCVLLISLPVRGAYTDVIGNYTGKHNFNPHSPCGERNMAPLLQIESTYFNPHSPCGECILIIKCRVFFQISILAPHAGSVTR